MPKSFLYLYSLDRICYNDIFLNLFHQLGITTYTPEGLLVGAKSIVHHNRKLRTEMKELEKELNVLRDQNQVMVRYSSVFHGGGGGGAGAPPPPPRRPPALPPPPHPQV